MSINQEERQAASLRSQSIYRDKSRRYIYYHKRSGSGYVIPQSGLQRFGIFQNRYPIAISLAILFHYLIIPNYLYSIIAMLVIGLAMEVYYRFIMMPAFIKIDNFLPDPKYNTEKSTKNNNNKRRFHPASILYCLFGIAMIASVIFSPSSTLNNVLMIVLALFSFYLAYKSHKNYFG